jgi:hypothetical protein
MAPGVVRARRLSRQTEASQGVGLVLDGELAA